MSGDDRDYQDEDGEENDIHDGRGQVGWIHWRGGGGGRRADMDGWEYASRRMMI